MIVLNMAIELLIDLILSFNKDISVFFIIYLAFWGLDIGLELHTGLGLDLY